MTLKISIAEAAVHARLRQAANAGLASDDLRFAQVSDVAPEDVAALRFITKKGGLLVVMRCPKQGAVAFQGKFPPKRWADGHDSSGRLVKSGSSGLGVHPETGHVFVSDTGSG